MEKLIASQKLALGELNRIFTNYKKVPKVKRTLVYAQKLKERLQPMQLDFESKDKQIRDLLTGDDAELESPYFVSNIRGNFEDIYMELIIDLQELVNECAPPSPVCEKHNSSTRADNESRIDSEEVNLPRITVPKFTSKYEDWVSFRDLFKSLIHDRVGLADVQKLHYLKCSLSGESETLLKHVGITDKNYSLAWKVLCDRYDNKQALLNVQFKKLFSLNTAQETALSLRALLDKTLEATQGIQTMGIADLWQMSLVYLTAQRLPPETRQIWEYETSASSELPSFDRMKSFLEQRFRALEAASPDRPFLKPQAVTKHVHNTYRQATKSAICFLCKGNHFLRSCEQFEALDQYAKLNTVKKANLCINCLGFGHRAANCTSNKRCNKCNQAHRTILHRMDSAAPLNTKEVGIHAVGASRFKEVLLATALVTIAAPNGSIVLRALLDQGSQASLISERAVTLLGLSRSSSKLHITGINGSTSTYVRGMTNIDLIDSDKQTITFEALILDRLTNLIPPNTISTEFISSLGDIKLADPTFYRPDKIDILLGADMYARLILDGIVQLADGAIAQRTRIGWILSGEIDISRRRAIQSYKVETSENTDTELNEQLKKFWEIEEGPRVVTLSDEDQCCENHYVANTRRQEDGRFLVSLPFKSQQAKESIGHSRHIAKASFDALERRFVRDSKFKEEYVKTMNGYIDAGYMCLVDHEDMITKGNYLPHHAVIKESTSTKLRVVFDASRKSSSGVSLNDALLTGPTIQNELIAVLMRFRKFRYAMVADISKMFCQVNMDESDSQFQKLLWRPDVSQPVKDYRLTTVTFGTTCAPFLAIRTLRKLAEVERFTYPLGAKIVLDDFYVDDMLSGDNDLMKANQKRQEVVTLLKSGGFQLRKWLTNDLRLLEGVPKEDIEMEESLNLDLDRSFKSLSIHWHPIKDYFSFRLNLQSRAEYTKRIILSDVASLYDPLGWIAPVIICLKILLRCIWQRGYSWDSPLPDDIVAHWVHLRKSLEDIQDIKIPRWIMQEQIAKLELHGFCDASQEAYGALVYLVARGTNETKVQLLIAKTKVAPIKSVTIPRLELCGAVVLSRLIKMVKEVYDFAQVETWLWCDNTTVVSWIQGHPSRWSVFVANRTAEIYNNVSNTPWRYVPSKQNPADLGSKGSIAHDLINNTLWWNGPHWLKEGQDSWLELGDIQETNLERRKENILKCLSIQNSELDELLHRYSSLTMLIRVTAYCMRFRTAAMKIHSLKKNLSTEELNGALEFWVKYIQQREFQDEIRKIQAEKPLTGRYQITNLKPFIEHDILRVGGRLKNARIPYGERHPIILPKCGKLTELILDHAHKTTLHGHTQLMLAYIRKQFWIIDGRNAIRHFVHKCIRCFKCKANTSRQLMGDLPAPRVNINRPFTHTGIDYCGPFTIRDRKGRGYKTVKCYVSVFVCLTIKAIHLELVSDLTTDAFFAALHRFVARRRYPTNLYSDCGSNFVGADIELRKIARSNDAVADKVTIRGVNWHFNPPAAPHFGGLWEAGVKSFKFHLRRVMLNTLLTFEEFTTVLVQIEACLNSRPMCPITDDPTDDSALTPGHFLIGDSLLSPPQVDVIETAVNRLNRWQLTQRLSQEFWKRWSKEYLHRLQQRPNWVNKTNNPNIGDLCLVKEDKIPPYKWPLARIIEVHPGKDGLVRVVTVRMKHSTFKRPIVKIALLPSSDL